MPSKWIRIPGGVEKRLLDQPEGDERMGTYDDNEICVRCHNRYEEHHWRGHCPTSDGFDEGAAFDPGLSEWETVVAVSKWLDSRAESLMHNRPEGTAGAATEVMAVGLGEAAELLRNDLERVRGGEEPRKRLGIWRQETKR